MVQIIRDIQYTTEENSSAYHQLDIYVPSSTTSSFPSNFKTTATEQLPVFIFFHGGIWRRGGIRSFYQPVGLSFAKRNYITVIPSYRLSPIPLIDIIQMALVQAFFVSLGTYVILNTFFREDLVQFFTGISFVLVASTTFYLYWKRSLKQNSRFPDHAEDVAEAIAWVAKNISKYGGDPEKIFISGQSAGAHLVSLVALDSKYLGKHGLDPTDVIKGVVGISGVYDYEVIQNNRLLRTFANLESVFGDHTCKWEEFFPLSHVMMTEEKSKIPFLILSAQFEVGLLESSTQFVSALKQQQFHCEHHLIPWTHHFSITFSIGNQLYRPLGIIWFFFPFISMNKIWNSKTAKDCMITNLSHEFMENLVK